MRADEYTIDCEAIRVLGDVVRATPADGGRELVVPLSNVTGLTGDVVEQEELPSVR